MNIAGKEKKIIEEFRSVILAACEKELDKIVFFGSRARGEGRLDSDYDLLLVVNKKSGELIDKIYEITTDFSLKHNIDISLKIYPVDDYRRKDAMPTPFFVNLRKTGVEIWNKLEKS